MEGSMDTSTALTNGARKMAQTDKNVTITTSPPTRGGRYGWGSFTPDCLQFLNSPFWLLVTLCVAVIAQSMLVNGLIGVSMSSIETRFDLSSYQAGAIPSVYDVAGLPFMLVIGYCGSVINRPRWIGIAMLLLGIAAIVFALPHFITDLYDWGGGIQDNLCHLDNDNMTLSEDHVGSSNLSAYLYIFITAAVLMSVGALPVYLLGVPFIDDCLSSHSASCYLGVFYAMTSLGPAIAFIAGGVLLEIYTDFYEINMDGYPLGSDDPRWVGAWWIGFLFVSVLCLINVLPIIGFPNILPGTEDVRKTKMAANMADRPTGDAGTQSGFLHKLLSILKDLLTNLTFVFQTLAIIGECVIVGGFTAFGPKYIENQFSISASFAAILFGVVMVPGAFTGTILGGWIIKRWKLSCQECLRGYVILCITFTCLCFFSFLIQCDNAAFVGVSSFPKEMVVSPGEKDIYFTCNNNCQCSTEKYEPICGSDNLVYFSPCFAGCQLESGDNDNVYTNCSCIQNGASSTATPGVCDSNYCTLLPLYLLTMLACMLVMFVAGMFHLQIILRCVRGDSRPLAISFDKLVGRVGGSFPAPLLFGAALDGSCILWEETRDGRGSCLYYDNHQMAWYLMALCIGCKLFNIFFAFLAWMAYKRKNKAPSPDELMPKL